MSCFVGDRFVDPVAFVAFFDLVVFFLAAALSPVAIFLACFLAADCGSGLFFDWLALVGAWGSAVFFTSSGSSLLLRRFGNRSLASGLISKMIDRNLVLCRET